MQSASAERHEMSGALPDHSTLSQSGQRPDGQPSNDRVRQEESGIGPEEDQFRAPSPKRRQSFFVISNRRRDADAGGNAAPPETIVIKPAQRTSTFEIGQGKKRRKKRPRESSLDAILRHAVNGPLADGQEAQIPLPESRPESPSSIRVEPTPQISVGAKAKSSLEIITEKGIPPIPSEALPSSIALPESRPQSLEETRDTQRQEPLMEQHQPQQQQVTYALPPKPPLPLYEYEHMVTRASSFLKHLEDGHINAISRHDTLKISYLDYWRTPGSPVIINRPDTQDDNHVLRILGNIPDNVRQRLIVVEDLSPRAISCLGRRFGVSPEFFEEHLINSGYEGLSYNDQPAHTWTTFGLKKSYVSMRWHRPVFRLPIVPFSENDLRELLDPSISRLEYTSDTSRHMSIYQTETNIFRSEWELWTDSRITSRMKRVCGWEERASIWSQKLPDRDCRIVVLVLDPLPTLGQGIERDVVAARRLPSESSGSRSLADDSDAGSFANWQRLHNMADVEALDRLADHMQKHELKRKPQVTRLQRIFQRMTGRGRPQKDDSEDELAGRYEYTRTTEFKAIRSRTIFEQTAHRAHVSVDYDDAFRSPHGMDILRQQLSDTRSTTVDFWERLTHAGNPNDGIGFSGVVTPLFQIVQRDSTNLLKLLQNALDGINVEILDDIKMEDRLAIWRQLITRAQLELPELKRSVTQFLSFLQILDPQDPNPIADNPTTVLEHTGGNTIPMELENLCEQIDNMMQRLQTASLSLTSNIALLDSRRSIAEAQAVTKLTELAFFFIPLSFAATLFGMQIEQFENRAPLWIFVVIGLGFVAAAYLVRLVIRSTWLRSLIQAYQASIRVYADSKRRPVQRGNVPASLFLGWASYEVNSAARVGISHAWAWLTKTIPKMLAEFWASTEFVINMLIIISVLAGAPIAVLWTRKIDHGIKIMITIIVLVCVIGLFAIPYWRYADPESRSALPRLFKKRFKHFHLSKLAVLFVIFCALAIAVVPLAIIWTRPVAPGIRAAITIVIVLLVVLIIVFQAVYRLISVARAGVEEGSSSSFRLSLADD